MFPASTARKYHLTPSLDVKRQDGGVSYTIGLIRYAIINGASSVGGAASLAAGGVDFIQLRNKTAGAAALADTARSIMRELAGSRTRLLINSRVDVAIAAGAAGVHLTAHPDELSVAQIRQVFALAGAGAPIVSVSCHTLAEAARARDDGADLILFAPVFEKVADGETLRTGAGLEALARVCAAVAPAQVLALGGVTAENTASCVQAGAAGVAGIRLFGWA